MEWHLVSVRRDDQWGVGETVGFDKVTLILCLVYVDSLSPRTEGVRNSDGLVI